MAASSEMRRKALKGGTANKGQEVFFIKVGEKGTLSCLCLDLDRKLNAFRLRVLCMRHTRQNA